LLCLNGILRAFCTAIAQFNGELASVRLMKDAGDFAALIRRLEILEAESEIRRVQAR
jgi:hypothetical protein